MQLHVEELQAGDSAPSGAARPQHSPHWHRQRNEADYTAPPWRAMRVSSQGRRGSPAAVRYSPSGELHAEVSRNGSVSRKVCRVRSAPLAHDESPSESP
jgi:hypothetical protein